MLHATLQQLRLFNAVGQHKSITRAAEDVHLTQPAVSIQVKRLEERVGMPLFEQVGKTLHLTVAGEEVHAACRDVLRRLEDLESRINDLQGEIGGPLRVTGVSSAKFFLPHLLGDYVREHPKVEPHMQITNRTGVLSRLSANEDDLYIMGQPPEDLAVEQFAFLDNVLVVVSRPDHPLAGRAAIALGDISRERIVGREKGSGTRQAVERLFREDGQTVSPYIELASSEAIKQGVMGGLGIAVLPMHSLRLELAAGELVILNVEQFPLRRKWYAVHRKGKRLSRAAKGFLTFLLSDRKTDEANSAG